MNSKHMKMLFTVITHQWWEIRILKYLYTTILRQILYLLLNTIDVFYILSYFAYLDYYYEI